MIRNALAAITLAVIGLQADAAPLTLSSATKGSSSYSMALAVVGAAEKSGMDLRPQPFKSASQGLGFVNTGEIDFGLDNAIALRQAFMGQGKFAGAAMADLRLVARLQPMRMTLAVRAGSGITSLADLRGKRLPSGFQTAVTGETLVSALLAAGGLGYDDVERVPISDFTAMAEAFVDGKIDAMIHVIGSPRDDQVMRDVGSFLPLAVPATDATKAALAEIFPEGSFVTVDPSPEMATITAPLPALQYDFFIFTQASAPDAEVTAMIDALRAGKDDMAAAVASLKWFDPEQMRVEIGVPYHPAAEAFFKANGTAE
jgi:TRAP transporter TAXI family solute receptor